MKIESIKNTNITLLFSEPLDHRLISQEGLLNLFKTGDLQKDLHTFVEAPGLKVVIFPNLKKEIAFEGVRLQVNDRSETVVEESYAVGDFKKIIDSNMIDRNKIVAYGFNYDAVVVPMDNTFKIDNLVNTKLASMPNVKSAGINMLFNNGNITSVLEIKPVGKENEFIAHYNAHFNTNKLPEPQELKKQIQDQFDEFKKIIQEI